MDLRDHLLQIKRFFEEEEKKYKGPDPLKIRCEFISCLERYDKAATADIYLPLLEDTLKQFKENPLYKQDVRFIQLWLNYSATQPNPIEVMERMHSRGLGTECAILYSSWADLLIKQGLLTNADNVFKMGLSLDVKPRVDLQNQYDEFLRDIGQKVLLGKIVCPKCGSSFKSSGGGCTESTEETSGQQGNQDVAVWEWNPLKVGEVDDFKCPVAYFEEYDPTKIRMYPREKVYPGNGEEFSLEEIMAEEYERKCKEQEAKQKALAEAKAREEEARRVRQELNELRKKEAEKFNTINEMNNIPVQATIPVVTPKMLNLKEDLDYSAANSTTFTVHTKEAMNVVQDMWSSPAPTEIRPRNLFHSETATKDLVPPVASSKPLPFEIYSEENPPQPTPKQPFQIYDENAAQRPANPSGKPKLPFEIYDENAPPSQDALVLPKQQTPGLKPRVPFEIYDENQAMKTPDDKGQIINMQTQNTHSKNKCQLFPDEDNGADLAKKLETQAKIQPFFNVQDRMEDFSDVTCNTKAFEFVLPSSTPLALHKKPLHSIQKFEGQAAAAESNTQLSVILESSKDKSTNSSAGSLAASAGSKPHERGQILQSDLTKVEEPLAPSIPFVRRPSHYRPSSLYPLTLLNTIEEETHSFMSLSHLNAVDSELLGQQLNDQTYLVQEKSISKNCSMELNFSLVNKSKTVSIPCPNHPNRKSSLKIRKKDKSQKFSIEKENLCPGMLGFPSTNLIEGPNSAYPVQRASRKKFLNIVPDKENVVQNNELRPCLLETSYIENSSKDMSCRVKSEVKNRISSSESPSKGIKCHENYVSNSDIKIPESKPITCEKESMPEKPLENKKRRGRPPKKRASHCISSKQTISEDKNEKCKPTRKTLVSLKSELIENKENLVPNSTACPKRMSHRVTSVQLGQFHNEILRDSNVIQLPDSVVTKNDRLLQDSLNTTELPKELCKKTRRKKAHTLVPAGFDPFNSSVIEELLTKIGFPKEHHLPKYHVKQTNLPTGAKSIKLGDEVYSILGEIGKGAYAKVLKANVQNSTVALKVEKPPCKWEFYIAKEIQNRVPAKYAAAFMDISAAFIFNNGSILKTDFAKYGTLLSNISAFKEKTGKSLDLGVVLHYSIELIDIVDYLHRSKIIHADMKPDNIVVRELPSYNESEPCLQLIDFGRCIDMNLLPPDTEFTFVFKTEDNKCIEMKENRPWTYQIDLQGLASIFHCLLFGEYMKVHKKNDRWTLQKLLPRNAKREVWNPIFDSLLNINPATDLPFNFAPIRASLVETFESSLNICLQNIKSYRSVISAK